MRLPERSVRMAMFYLVDGMTQEQIAVREGVSTARVGQVLKGISRILGTYAISHAKHGDISRYVNYLRSLQAHSSMYIFAGQATTPEEFFWELINEWREL